MPTNILVFAGSTRAGALSHRMALAAAADLAEEGALVTLISLADYPMALYNGDDEAEHGIPDSARRLARLMAGHDGFVICSPEYNASIPPLLKNTLDWVSRIREDGGKPLKPFAGKAAAICGTSDGKLGGMRMLPHLRQVLQNLGLLVISEQVALGEADKHLSSDGVLDDPMNQKRLKALSRELIHRAGQRHDR